MPRDGDLNFSGTVAGPITRSRTNLVGQATDEDREPVQASLTTAMCLLSADALAGGLEVAEKITCAGLPTKVLLASGYSLELARTMEGKNLPLLTQPFRRGELLRKICLILDD